MGFVRQYERKAIEEVTTDARFLDPLNHEQAQRYYFGTQEIFLWGISEGIGTCSSIKGRNIAVFCLRQPDRPLIRASEPYEYAALIRILTPLERTAVPVTQQNAALLLAECLFPLEITAHFVSFVSTDKKREYVNVV